MDWEGEYTLFEFFEKSKNLYPPTNNLIQSQLNLFNHLSTSPEKLIIRKFGSLTRGRVYNINKLLVATSDNEGCCGFYQNLYTEQWKSEDLFQFFIRKRHNLAWKIDENCSSEITSVGASLYGLRGGGNPGEPFRTEYEFKISHFLSAAEGLPPDTNLSLRAARFLSPFNIILTPKKARINKKSGSATGYIHTIIKGKEKNLVKNDIGETPYYLNILHALLINHLIKKDPSCKDALEKYCMMCEIEPIDLASIANMIELANATIIKFTRPIKRPSNIEKQMVSLEESRIISLPTALKLEQKNQLEVNIPIRKITNNQASRSRTGVTDQNNENTGKINESYRNQIYHMNLSWKLGENSPELFLGFFEFNINECVQRGYIRDNGVGNGFRFRIQHLQSGDIVLQLNQNGPSYLMGHITR